VNKGKPKLTPKKGKSKKLYSSRLLTPAKRAAFLAVLAECCNVGRACAAVGITRVCAYEWREKDPAFANAWEQALKMGVSALEDEAHRRAFDGVDEPVFHQGAQCATIKKYSDTLAIFLLKAHNPEKYRDNAKLELSGRVEMSDVIMAARTRMDKDAQS